MSIWPSILTLVLLHLVFEASLATTEQTSGEFFAEELFSSWCKKHGKIYAKEEEKLHRLEIFKDNLKYIEDHNSNKSTSFMLGVNVFSDLSHQEFKERRFGGLKVRGEGPRGVSNRRGSRGKAVREVVSSVRDDVPGELDWREKGAVTAVKDQAQCGACWAFSSTGAIEGINQIVTGSLVSLSEQELVDCDKSYNSGCNGGLMDYAFKFVIKNQGIDTEQDYPYQAGGRTCNKNKQNNHVVSIDGYTDVPPSVEDQLLKAVASQPVSVGICGSERAFQSYSKGIFNSPCSTSLDHAVLIVGYGSENGVDYWILKNSWGKGWGINGYMHMQRNNGNKDGICGINMMASYPTKTNPNPPPSPSPGPSKCSAFTYCAEGETCCCGSSFLGICLKWQCCELESAVCCKDHRSCCPHDYPICDTKRQQCLKVSGNSTIVKGIEKKCARFGGWSSLIGAWNL